MKLRFIVLTIFAGLLLSACNFSLASDVTPPPDYVSPTPAPTLGALYPSQAPNVQNGATIFETNCVPCHGEKGLGDGPQSQQLPNPVAAIGLADVARPASPAQWFTTVTQGNLDRFMPPFGSTLTDQERWDAIAYALSLHATSAQIQQGKTLFESKCGTCAGDFFNNLEKMSALSENDLVDLIKSGGSGVPAFGAGLSDDELHDIAMYLRSQTFSSAELAATSVPTIATPAAAENGTPSAVETPLEGTAQANVPAKAAQPGNGTVSGTVVTSSGAPLQSELSVKLHGFDHAQDQATGPQEVLTLDGVVKTDGTFTFDNVAMPENRIFTADVIYEGVTYQSQFGVAKANATQVTVPPVQIYESTNDFSGLSFDQVHVAFDFGQASGQQNNTVQVFEIYTFSNRSKQSVIIPSDGTNIPFIAIPEGAQNIGFESGQNTATFLPADTGFAIAPSDKTYSLIAFFNVPYDSGKATISQPLVIPAASLLLFMPEGIKVQSSQLTDTGIQNISDTNFHTYTANNLAAGDSVTFSFSGQPAGTASTLPINQALIYGAGTLGLVLIALGAWLYFRDRKRPVAQAVETHDEFEDTDSILDAIIALDDLHRAGKIPDDAYRQRRAELKELLKKEM
ncbi:MAG TPA: cytochrome c [Anaerolineales bacterium]|nr:cytochrome c [Anaerolineales bacterium]